jgi:acetoin utilization deacetylase AcuC-like enzyme
MNEIGLAIISSEETHRAPEGHPERATRLFGIVRELESGRPAVPVTTLYPSEYGLDTLKAVHSAEYIDELASYRGVGVGYLDSDTYRSATSFEASCAVTWALLCGVETGFGAGPSRSFILGRPPGHHAGRETPMGFCLVNHVAVAAQFVLDRGLGERVAIVDFDVHHGNGTQEIFYDRADVLYISIHQYPFYPGTGAKSEVGTGNGSGFTMNFPFPAGLEDAQLVRVCESEITDRLAAFRPDLILVSAGFDGHYLDPLGGFNLTGEAYRRLAEILRARADELCGGRLVSLMEGGYSLDGNLDAISNYLRGLAD